MDYTRQLTSSLCENACVSGPQMVLLITLGAITVFRREMSCNHCYAAPEDATVTGKSTEDGSTGMDEWWCAMDQHEAETEELLNGAGLYCSGASVLPTLTPIIKYMTASCYAWKLSASRHHFVKVWSFGGLSSSSSPPKAITISVPTNTDETDVGTNSLTRLPPDALVNILSFLLPKDVVSFACVDKSCQDAVECGETSEALWKSLWHRDYAWLIHAWTIGRGAFDRSGLVPPIYDKEFYFLFGLSYLNYVLAGQNTFDSCLIGLNGHIYDLTPFLMNHPGSPETVMVQAGRDSTSFFHSIRHSSGARKIAQSLCVAVNVARLGDNASGVRPTCATNVDTYDINRPHGVLAVVESPAIETLPSLRKLGTLERLRHSYSHQEERYRIQALANITRVEASLNGEVHVYYDPFRRSWCAWYNDSDLQPVFCSHL